MKANWWKAIIVLVLIAVVVLVVAMKDGGPGPQPDSAAKPDETLPSDQRLAVKTGDVDSEPQSESPEPDLAAEPAAPEAKPKPAAETAAPGLKPKKVAAEPLAAPPAKPAARPVPKRLPKLLELGADKCVPCKMMKPVIEELKREYAGKLQVEFIDVWVTEGAAQRYGIDTIPTQILYDADGRELLRHTGFFSKEDILAAFRKAGIEL